MNIKIDIEKTGAAIKLLAELLTLDDSKVTADDLLNVLEGRVLMVEEVTDLKKFLAA